VLQEVFCWWFLALAAIPLFGQGPATQFVSAEPTPSVTAKRGATVEIPLKLTIRQGYHINSNTPAEDYLIPTVLSWDSNQALTAKGVTYPKGEAVKYDFSEKPLQVYSGAITLVSRFAVPGDAPLGPAALRGKFRYQACNDKMCFPPRTLPVSISIAVQ
jgi:hypothetical protein